MVIKSPSNPDDSQIGDCLIVVVDAINLMANEIKAIDKDEKTYGTTKNIQSNRKEFVSDINNYKKSLEQDSKDLQKVIKQLNTILNKSKKTSRSTSRSKSRSTSRSKSCPVGKVLNKNTGRCNKKKN